MQIHQVNLQHHFGGGEVYTAFLCQALDRLGVTSTLFVHPKAGFWGKELQLPDSTCLVPVTATDSITIPFKPWVLGHGALARPLLDRIHALKGLATAIAHMPVQGRRPEVYLEHDRIFPVSGWVRDGLLNASLPVWNEPLYGIANLNRSNTQLTRLRRESRYDWDLRKGRDRVLSWLEPWIESLRSHPVYTKRTGLTLGIVSRLTPIKQFPLLFTHLAPILAGFPNVNLEIFGSGGYGSVRDLTRALQPIADRVRFWGHQSDVATVYHGIDYLLTGLPEKEALGLNLIEAQALGVPVIAPNAPPFTETILAGKTGFLYTDPRDDHGEGFRQLLSTLLEHERPDPRQQTAYLERFSPTAFEARLRPIIAWAEGQLA